MTTSTHFWLRLLLWVVFGSALGSAAVTALKHRWKKQITQGGISDLKRLVLVLTGEGVAQRASKFGFLLLGAAVGFLLGMGYRDHQLSSNVITYQDVLIGEKLGDNHFYLQPARMQPIESILCSPSVDWEPGQIMRYFRFEQQRGCKRVIAFERYQKGVTNASLATR